MNVLKNYANKISFDFNIPIIAIFYFLKFQTVYYNNHESAKTLVAENAIIDEETKKECQRNGDTKTKTIISNEILKRVTIND